MNELNVEVAEMELRNPNFKECNLSIGTLELDFCVDLSKFKFLPKLLILNDGSFSMYREAKDLGIKVKVEYDTIHDYFLLVHYGLEEDFKALGKNSMHSIYL